MMVTPESLIAQLEADHGKRIGVCVHTDDLSDNDIFVALGPGVEYIQEASTKGAIAVVCDTGGSSDHDVDHAGRIYHVNGVEEFARSLITFVYGHEIAQVRLIGITGTNGKTSTAYFASQLLNLLGERAGYIGTLGYGVVGEQLQSSRNTTPDIVTLYRYIAILYREGCKTILLEVSSHAIALGRIDGLRFSVAVFTNLSRDHLDFHGTMDAYEETKFSYFTDYVIDRCLVNISDSSGVALYSSLLDRQDVDAVSYGWAYGHGGGYRTVPHYLIDFDSSADVIGLTSAKQGMSRYKVQLRGIFNIENVSVAIMICHLHGHGMADIAAVVHCVDPVPGRMECLKTDKGSMACVDYAHTPSGVESVLGDKTMSRAKATVTWCVFGCGGDRDTGKRPLMGEVAARLSDKAVITDDNVRNDRAEEIICDIVSGIASKSGLVVCRDRAKAIEHAVLNAAEGDRIFVLGKGNEAGMNYGGRFLPFNDVDSIMGTAAQ